MTTKAQKLRSKRIKQRTGAGRKRKAGERYPSGDLKRGETEKETKSVAIAAAARVHGIITDGQDGLHGYVLGRIFLDGRISRQLLNSGNHFAETMERYYRSVGIPSPNPRAQDVLAVRGYDGDPSEQVQKRAKSATDDMMRLEGILLRQGPGVKQTVRSVCIEDNEGLRLMPSAQLALLAKGLKAIAMAEGVQ